MMTDGIDPSKLSRREFVPLLAAGLAMVGVISIYTFPGLILKLKESSAKPRQKPYMPRFRTKNRNNYLTELKPGFYRNRRSNVIHYVSEKTGSRQNVIHRVSRINENNLIAIPNILAISPMEERVTVRCYSYALERETAASLNAHDTGAAFERLTYALQYDLTLPSHSRRLYDLFAGLTVKFGQEKKLKSFIQKIERHPPMSKEFKERLKKWQAGDNNWRRSWTTRKTWSMVEGCSNCVKF